MGKTVTRGFICIYLLKSNFWRDCMGEEHPIPWDKARREIGVICSLGKTLDHVRFCHHTGEEPSAFQKGTWTKVASTGQDKWRKHWLWESKAKPSDARKLQCGISKFKLDTPHLDAFIFSSLDQHNECKNRLGNILPSSAGRKYSGFLQLFQWISQTALGWCYSLLCFMKHTTV